MKSIQFEIDEMGVVEIKDKVLLEFINGGAVKKGKGKGGTNMICAPNEKDCTQNANC